MKLVLSEPKYFKESIALISDLVNEVRFKIDKDGLELIAMDPANVAMVVFKLFPSCFTKYEVKEVEYLALNLNNLKQILRRAKANDLLVLETKENKLKTELKGEVSRIFYLPLIDLEEKKQKIPELNFPLSVEMASRRFNESIEDCSIVAESVTLIGEKNNFTIKGEGDLSKVFIEMKPNEETKIITDSLDKIKSKFSIEYLKKMVGGSKLADKVILSLANDYPLKLDFREIDKFSLVFILAPRVDSG